MDSNDTNYLINFTIPQGITGPTGPTGPTGETGLTPSFAIGTVTTGAPGSNASVTINPI